MKNPRTRRTGISSLDEASYTTLYDSATGETHGLNAPLALVWQSADGQKSIDDLGRLLHSELGIPPDRTVVLLALQELAAAGLLDQPLALAAPTQPPTRRQVADRLATAGLSAALVPAMLKPAVSNQLFELRKAE